MPHTFPKIIWMLWFQGWASPPELVRACARTWQLENPGWTIRFIDATHVEQLFVDCPWQIRLLQMGIPKEALSNVVRLALLARFGGVWADATTYCLGPLDDWLPAELSQGFFAFREPARDRMLSTWFLAAIPASPAVIRWQSLVEAYWRERTERHTYFWCHQLFAEAYKAFPEVRQIWDGVPKHSADGPHTFVPYQKKLFRPVTEKAKTLVLKPRTPMLKLTHKLDFVTDDCGTLYRWLCDRILQADPDGSSLEEWPGCFTEECR